MLTIAWDVDDILNDLMYYWFNNKWLAEHPDCKISFEQITENTPERILNTTKEEYLASLDNFRLSKGYLEMKPNAQIAQWFSGFGDKARHIALTAVPVKAAHISADWVLKNFGRWIRSFNFVPSPRAGGQIMEYSRNKIEFLKWFNKIDILVEDNSDNLRGVDEIGIKGILVKKPWNKSNLPLENALTEINTMIMDKV